MSRRRHQRARIRAILTDASSVRRTPETAVPQALPRVSIKPEQAGAGPGRVKFTLDIAATTKSGADPRPGDLVAARVLRSAIWRRR